MRCGVSVFLDLKGGFGHFFEMQNFDPIDHSLHFSRQDINDPRLGDLVGQQPDTEITILGYPDDEGVRINGGREGAHLGPQEIRRQLYRMTPHPKRKLKAFADMGNLRQTGTLDSRHAKAAQAVSECLSQGAKILSLGGGNDYAFADGEGFLSQNTEKPLIINVDAHFDVRDVSRGLSSGTPFYRLLESGADFDFIELGIQTHCNSRLHWDYVEQKGGRILTMDEVLESGDDFSESALRKLGDWVLRRRPTFIAIDMDAFAYPFAPGTSASWPLGILPHDFIVFLHVLLSRLDVRVMGLYEVAPQLETGQATAKLAAQFAHRYLHND